MNYIFKNKFYIFVFIILDFLGYLIFSPFVFLTKRKLRNAKNILILRLDHIGDVIYSTVVLKSLKDCYPDAKVTFLAGSWAREILENNPYIDQIICYDAPWFNRNKSKIFEIRGLFKLIKQLRKNRYDLGIDLRGDFRHILLMSLVGVRFRAGYGITGGAFLLHKEARYRKGVHTIEHNLDLLRSIGVKIASSDPKIYSDSKTKEFIDSLFREYGFKDRDFIVAVHPYAGYSSKNWLDTRFAELINALYAKYNAKICLIGSDKDKSRNEHIIMMAKAPAINLAGKIQLGALSEFLNNLDFFIGVDSAPSHIAALAGISGVVLYSGTNRIEEWGPGSNNLKIIQKNVSCRDCQKLICDDNLCMQMISVEDVLGAIEEALKI